MQKISEMKKFKFEKLINSPISYSVIKELEREFLSKKKINSLKNFYWKFANLCFYWKAYYKINSDKEKFFLKKYISKLKLKNLFCNLRKNRKLEKFRFL